MRNAQLLFDHDQNLRLLHVFDYMSIATKYKKMVMLFVQVNRLLFVVLLRLDRCNSYVKSFFIFNEECYTGDLFYYKKPAVKLASGINKN